MMLISSTAITATVTPAIGTVACKLNGYAATSVFARPHSVGKDYEGGDGQNEAEAVTASGREQRCGLQSLSSPLFDARKPPSSERMINLAFARLRYNDRSSDLQFCLSG